MSQTDQLPKIGLQKSRSFVPKIRALGQKRALGGDLYHYILSHGWFVLIAIVFAAFLLGNALFSLAYLLQPGSISHTRPGSFADTFFFSVETMATIGYGGMAPATPYAHVLVTVEALTGVVAFALVAGITFAKFSRPIAKVLFGNRAVITSRNGVPHLMFRLANWRHNEIVQARLTVVLMVSETTAEGEFMRRLIDVPLVRDRTPLFALTWTAMHHIDALSPFHGVGALDRLREQQAEIFLSVHGTDERLAQSIHARYSYKMDDIFIGARFADVLTVFPDGLRVVDYRNFHEIVPFGPGITDQLRQSLR